MVTLTEAILKLASENVTIFSTLPNEGLNPRFSFSSPPSGQKPAQS